MKSVGPGDSCEAVEHSHQRFRIACAGEQIRDLAEPPLQACQETLLKFEERHAALER
ncbi:MAG: hypothetical protein M3041_16995 [Acidobacteriota bacterium]|nr:hypothetical protein [Acidobacteriota bacterium]